MGIINRDCNASMCYYMFTVESVICENIWFNDTKIAFNREKKQHIGFVLIIFVIAMYIICTVVKGNYKCDSNNNNESSGHMIYVNKIRIFNYNVLKVLMDICGNENVSENNNEILLNIVHIQL